MKPKYTHKTTGRSPLALVIAGFIVTLALVLLGASWSTAFGGTVPDANSAPSNLQANGVSTTQINLIFTDNSSDEAGFKVERKTGLHGTWAEIGTIPANGGPNGSVQCGGTIPCNGYGTIGYQDTNGLQPGTLYFYRIRAYESGSLFSPYSNEGNAYTQSSRVVTKSIDDGTPGSFSYELSLVDANNKVITFKPGVYGITIPAGGTIPTIPDGTSIGGTCDTASDTGPVIIIDARNASAASKAAGLNLSGGGTFYGIPFQLAFARDYAVRDFKSYLKTSHAARPASVNPGGMQSPKRGCRWKACRGMRGVPSAQPPPPYRVIAKSLNDFAITLPLGQH